MAAHHLPQLGGFYYFDEFTYFQGSCYCSVTKLYPSLCDSMDCSTPGFPVHHQLLELVQTHVHRVLSSVISFSSCLQSFPASGSFIRKSVLHIKWPKYWSFSISPSNEYSGLISFRIDSFDLLTVQGTLRSLIQHHNLKASILQHQFSDFLIVQLAHPYMTIGKTTAF